MEAIRRPRALAAILAALAAAAIAPAGAPATGAAKPASRLVGPAAFAAAVADSRTVTINVHVPDEGSIPGTKLWIPFDQIRAHVRELPAKATRLAIYCRSGRMSAIAARTLQALGYRNVVELRGGMWAWEAAGRRLLPPGVR